MDWKELLKLIILFIIGGIIYMSLEILWRGFTHWTMGIVGGLCFIIIGGINNYLPWEMPIWAQAGLGGCIITALEFISGLILNVWLGLGIWSYAGVIGNVMGQICLPFTLLWIALSFVGIVLDDWLRWKLFGEAKPKYYWRIPH